LAILGGIVDGLENWNLFAGKPGKTTKCGSLSLAREVRSYFTGPLAREIAFGISPGFCP